MSVKEKEKQNYQRLAIAIGAFILLVKFFTYWLTGSNAILSDALESIINVLASSFALYSVILAARPQDENHPYGHGKIEFLSVGLEGTLIILAGLATIGKAIYNFFHPQDVDAIDYGILLTAFSGLLNFGLAQLLLRKGKELGSLSMVGDGRHLMTDVFSSIGLIAGLTVLYFTGQLWLDNLIAIAFGCFIIYSGFRLLRDFISGIMDEADVQLISKVISILNTNRRRNWMDIHNLRIIKYGHGLHVDCHATIPWYFTLEKAHKEVTLIDQLVNQNLPNEVEFFIHADPCEPPRSCAICMKDDCHVRQQAFKKKIEWKLLNVLPNKKHDIHTS